MPAILRTDLDIKFLPIRNLRIQAASPPATLYQNGWTYDPASNQFFAGCADGYVGVMPGNLQGAMQSIGPFPASSTNTNFYKVVRDLTGFRDLVAWGATDANIYGFNSDGSGMTAAAYGGNTFVNAEWYATFSGWPYYLTISGDDLVYSTDQWTTRNVISGFFPGTSDNAGYVSPDGSHACISFNGGVASWNNSGDPIVQANWTIDPQTPSPSGQVCGNANGTRYLIAYPSADSIGIYTPGAGWIAFNDDDIYDYNYNGADILAIGWSDTINGWICAHQQGAFSVVIDDGSNVCNGLFFPSAEGNTSFDNNSRMGFTNESLDQKMIFGWRDSSSFRNSNMILDFSFI